MPPAYQVKTGVFEGPLELLLDLVEKRKLFINEISLADIADDYIAEVRAFEKMPVALVSNFLIVAATLVLIKSKSLLPTLSLTEEETQDIDELKRRLSEYQKIRMLTPHIRRLFGAKVLFPRGEKRRTISFSPSEEITISALLGAIQGIILLFPQKISLPKVIIKKVISLEEMMERLTERIMKNLKISFRDFSGIGKEEKINVIVSFLAMLELVKQGMIAVTQAAHGEDIHMETGVLETPKYGGNSS